MTIVISGGVYKTERSYVTGKNWVYYSFKSSALPNGMYAEGDWQTSDPGPGENEEKAIQATMNFLHINRWDISGQEHTKPAAAPPSKLEIMTQQQVVTDQQTAANQAQQLIMKANMLMAPGAVWASQAAYDRALMETNSAIAEHNSTPMPNTGLETVQIPGTATEPPKDMGISSGAISLLSIPVLIVVIIFYFIFKR